ncbi:MAG: CAP domain-containing protein [Chloroflexi bacterium]|nr:CAP domain-containing protein [Chloroflexota bacterium]
MLGLINADRAKNGVPPVALGDNPAAQQHAEEMPEKGYLSHWELSGLKPYMRYTLAGGQNNNAENVSSMPYKLDRSCNYRKITSIKDELRKQQQGFMESPGHRATILDKWHKKVNLGIACDQYTCSVVQQFEGDYVEFHQLPQISGGILRMSGYLKDGFVVNDEALIAVWYDEPPHALTIGQLQRTHSYTVGQRPVAFVRKPLSGGYYYTTDSTREQWTVYPDPYKISPSTEPIVDSCSGLPRVTQVLPPETREAVVPHVTANVLSVQGNSFVVHVDLSDVLNIHGKGVYTVLVWGKKNGEAALMIEYSIFVLN